MSFAIIARLGLDTKDYEAGLKKAAAKTNALTGSFRGIGAQLGSLFSAGAILKFAKDAVNLASSIQDSAEAARMGVEEYQALAFAAREGGADVAQLNTALAKATLAGEDAAAGNENLRNAFARLGIAVAAFNRLPTEQKLAALGKAYLDAGESQKAFSDISEILGGNVAPKLLGVLKQLGTDGFASVANSAKNAGNVMEKALVDSLDRQGDAFERLKVRALGVFAEIMGGLEIVARVIGGQSKGEINDAMFGDGRRNKAREQARKELEAEARKESERRRSQFGVFGSLIGRAAGAAPVTDAMVESRASEIIARQAVEEKQAGKDAAARAEAYERQAKALEMSAASAEVRDIIEKAHNAALREEMTTHEQIVALEKEKEAAMLRAQNITGEGDRASMIAAAREVAAYEKEIADTKKKQREEEEKARKADKEAAKQRVEKAKELAEIETARIDRTSTTISELAAGGRNLGGDAVRGARRVQRLEDQAMRARTRGETDFADRLQAEAEGIRQKIPGLQSSEKDFSKNSFEKLASIDEKMTAIAQKVGVAK